MSTTARLDLQEDPTTIAGLGDLGATTLDLTGDEPILDVVAEPTSMPDPALLESIPAVAKPTDDPAMRVVYAGTVLLFVLLAIAAVLALR